MEERLAALLRLLIKYSGTEIFINNNLQSSITEIDMKLGDGERRRVKVKQHDNKLIGFLKYMANIPEVLKSFEPKTGHFDMLLDGQELHLRFAVIQGTSECKSVLRLLNNCPDIA